MNLNSIPTRASGVAERNRLKSMLVVLLGTATLGSLAGEVPIAIAVILLSLIVSVRLWNTIGKDIAIADLASFIAVLQWIICLTSRFIFRCTKPASLP